MRFNVGTIGDLAHLESWEWDRDVYPRYKRPPSRNGYYSPLRDRSGDWHTIQEAHFMYLEQVLARARTVDPRSRARHEPLISEYLSLTLGRNLDSLRPNLAGEQQADAVAYWEGSALKVPVTRYERDRRARRKCLEVLGYKCAVCDMSFGETYGSEVEKFIHVHHITPLAERGEGYAPDPVRDLVPICPNCHAVVHAVPGRTRSIEEVRGMMRSRRTV